MHLSSITIRNFRCFGNEPTTVTFANCTALIGGNGAGKSTVLHALLKLFGTNQSERRLNREDFHIPLAVRADTINELELSIEAHLTFPELAGGDGEPLAVPELFGVMVVDGPQGTPFCRIRLTGKWRRSNLPDGDIDEQLHWIMTSTAEPTDADFRVVRGHERDQLHVVYIPATRDPSKQLRSLANGTVLRLLQSVEWSDETCNAVEAASGKINEAVQGERAVELLQQLLSRSWRKVHDLPDFVDPELQTSGSGLAEIIRSLTFAFTTSIADSQLPVQRMSDGLRSLFYFTLVTSAFEFQQCLLRESEAESSGGIAEDGSTVAIRLSAEIQPPALTLFAVEEPENHIAPHYLARITEQLKQQASHPRGQVVLTSHSASIVSRVAPTDLRHFRQQPDVMTAVVNSICLPTPDDMAFSFVKEAVQAFPELYFSRFVILCEGDSEQVILPRVGEALGVPLDRGLVSVVPLGGRHVNYFWKLLTGLGIPHCTLIDLDLGREHGGWARIAYLVRQLLQTGVDPALLLVDSNGATLDPIAAADTLARADNAEIDRINYWLTHLESFGVFMSAPLDVDLLLLEKFPAEYQTLQPGDYGPRIPDWTTDRPAYDARIARSVVRVLGEAPDQAVYTKLLHLFPWYGYLFLDRSKPLTHFESLARVSQDRLKNDLPDVLHRVLTYVSEFLLAPISDKPGT